MLLSWVFAAVHLIALGVGLGAIFARSRALRGSLDADGLHRVFFADNLWGLAALLWLGTGIPRAFMGLAKGSDYYLHQPSFHLKMALFLLIVGLEILPMLTLIRWRRGHPAEPAQAAVLARISTGQTAIVVVMVFVATAMARGL